VSGSPYDGKKVDVWSLGIVLYAMLCGRFPFMVNKPTVSDSEFYRLLFNKIQNKKLHFSRKVILSAEVKDLLNRMLDKNPFTRITMKEVLIHPWVQNRRLQIQPNKEKKKKKKKRTFLSRTTSLTTSHCIKNHSFEQEHCDNKQKNRQLSASGILATRHRAHDIIVKQFVKDHSDNSSKKSAPSQQQQQQQQQQQHSKQERSCTHFLKTSKETDR
jgi:serine/threonine protein kinase